MATQRATKLYWNGEQDSSGNWRNYFAFVPTRDLEKADIDALTDEQYADITGAPAGQKPLYQKTKPAARKRAEDGADDHDPEDAEFATDDGIVEDEDGFVVDDDPAPDDGAEG